SGAMKPKPFSALNHFTVPCAMLFLLFLTPDSVGCRVRGPPGRFRAAVLLNPPKWKSKAPRPQPRSCERALSQVNEHRSCDRCQSTMFTAHTTVREHTKRPDF